MRIYFDLCALKRPWDDQTQVRVALETAIVRQLVGLAERGIVEAVRSFAHDQENARNPNLGRALAIAEWLGTLPRPRSVPRTLYSRASALADAGLGPFDALHLAWATSLGSHILITTDDRFARRASRLKVQSPVRVVLPAEAMRIVMEQTQ